MDACKIQGTDARRVFSETLRDFGGRSSLSLAAGDRASHGKGGRGRGHPVPSGTECSVATAFGLQCFQGNARTPELPHCASGGVCGEGGCAVGTGGCEVARPHQQVALGRKEGGEGKWLPRNGQPQACGEYLKAPRNKWGRGVGDTCH